MLVEAINGQPIDYTENRREGIRVKIIRAHLFHALAETPGLRKSPLSHPSRARLAGQGSALEIIILSFVLFVFSGEGNSAVVRYKRFCAFLIYRYLSLQIVRIVIGVRFQ